MEAVVRRRLKGDATGAGAAGKNGRLIQEMRYLDMTSILTWFKGFPASAQPLMVRRTYAREQVVVLTMPVAISVIEGGTLAVLARLLMGFSPQAVMALAVMPMVANTSSLVWAALARGRRKMPMATALMLGTLLGVAGVGLAPVPDEPGGLGLWEWALVGYVLWVRVLLCGVVTLRSVLWRQNYRRGHRASVTARLLLVMSLLLAMAAPSCYHLLDADPMRFRWLYPMAAAVGVIGAISFGRIRLRGEQMLLAQERASHQSRWPLAGARKVLKEDPLFARYLGSQFLAGVGNMTAETMFVERAIALAATRSEGGGYGLGVLLTITVPMLMAMLAMPLWARYLDKVHIARFRTRHGLCWLVAIPGYGLAFALGSLWLLVAFRLVQGMARGGAMLAWNLGHNDFARKEHAGTYMGIHVFLTGVRGVLTMVLAPILLLGVGPIGGLGPWAFVVSGGFCLLAWLGFVALDREIRKP